MRRAVPVVVQTTVLLALVAGLTASPASAQADTGSVEGRVTDAAGVAVAGTCVTVYAEELSEPATVLTQQDGTYAVEDVPAGEAFVGFNDCEDADPAHLPEYFDDARTIDEAVAVTVPAGGERTDVDAQLEPAGSISGTVTDEGDGTAVEGVCVLAVEVEGGSSFGRARSEADGSYEVGGLAGGEHLVVFADCTEPAHYVLEYFDDVSEEEARTGTQPTMVEVVEGEGTTGVDAALVEGGAVVGTLTALHTGRPASGVCVGVVEVGADEVRLAAFSGIGPDDEPLDDPGGYVVGGVPAGTYDVLADPDSCGDDGWATVTAGRAEVTAGQTEQLPAVVVAPRPSTRVACPFDRGDPRFPDVTADNAHVVAVECAAERQIVRGRPDGTYGPDEGVRRAQMATVVAGVLDGAGLPLPADPPDAFDDDQGTVHELATNQLAALGVVAGKGGRRFDPSAVVTRGQLASVLVAGYEEVAEVALRSAGDAFSDDEGDVHESAIDRAATAGLAAGRPDGRFEPLLAVRRDQAATFAMRLLDRLLRDLGGPYQGQAPAEPPAG